MTLHLENPFQNLELISGPVSWYYFEFLGRKLVLWRCT